MLHSDKIDNTIEGELVYTSDALPSVPVPPAPIPIREQISEYDEDILDTEGVLPLQAFEMFSGKNFPPSNDVVTRRRFGRHQVMETRGERLARIANELNELEGGNDSIEDVELANKEIVNSLQQRLAILRQEDLKSRHANLTKNLEKSYDTKSIFVNKNLLSATEINVSTLEERLAKLENRLGFVSLEGPSMMDRIIQAEQNVNSVNEEILNQAAAKAKIIRLDLENASKAKMKLNINSSNLEIERISKLYTQMTDLSGFLSPSANSTSSILNAIVDRLSTCSNLHKNASDFSNDLKNVEGTVQDIKNLLLNLEETVTHVEKSLDMNLSIIKENLEELDKRLD